MPDPLAYSLSTAPRSASRTATAAIAIFDFRGNPGSLEEALSGPSLPEPGQLRLVLIPGIDEALLCRITPTHTQLHTHAGPFIVRRLADRLAEHGISREEARVGRVVEPIVHWLAHAPSPRAIDLLLAQRRSTDRPVADRRLDRLLIPPLIVALGPPNAGKSSLLNTFAQRNVAIVSEQAGTTRDSVGAMLELDGVAVRWLDLPGIRETEDPIEAEAIRNARRWARQADLVLGCSPDGRLPTLADIGVDLSIRTKSDLPSGSVEVPGGAISCSSRTGEGIAELAATIRNLLVPDEILLPTFRWELPRPSDSVLRV